MTAREAAGIVGVSYDKLLRLLQCGKIKAVKNENGAFGKWDVNSKAARQFSTKQKNAIEKLRMKYIDLYNQGLAPEQIQKHVKNDFADKGITTQPERHFATLAIWDSIPKRGDKDGNIQNNY